jgi:hypothetical protein
MMIRRLSILTFQETRVHCTARCLEYDMAATGRSTESAVDALLKMVRAHIEFDRRHAHHPLSAFAPAPRIYWEAFRRGARQWDFEMSTGPAHTDDMPMQVAVAFVPDHPAIRPALAARIA